MENSVFESYPLKGVILVNIIVLVWLLLGTYAIWLVVPVLAAVWGAYLVVMFLFVMRKSLCTKCRYYGERCSMGWGWYTSKLFKKGSVEEFPGCFGARFAPFLWMGVCIVPVLVLVVSLILEFTILKVILLLVLVIIAFLFGNKNSRKEACSVCKMNDLCPMGIATMSGEDDGPE